MPPPLLRLKRLWRPGERSPRSGSHYDWLAWADAHASAIDPLGTPLKELAEGGEAQRLTPG